MRTNKFILCFLFCSEIFFLALCTAAVAGTVSQKLVVDLNTCVDLALHYNDEIKAQTIDIDIYRSKKIEATKRYVPVIKYNQRLGPAPRDIDNAIESFFGGDITVFNSGKLELGWPIDVFGKISTARALADIGIDAAELQTKKKADEVVLNIHKLYYGILLARELKSLAVQALDAINKKIEELEKEDNSDQLGILKLKVVSYEVERRYDEALTKEDVAVASMKALLGVEPDVEIVLKSQSLTPVAFQIGNFAEYQELSEMNQTERQLLKEGVFAKQQKLKLEKKAYYPDLNFGGFAELGLTPGVRGDETDNDFTNPLNYKRAALGLDLKGELDFRKLKAKTSEAEVDWLKAISLKRAATKGLDVDLKKSYLELVQYRNLVTRADKEMKAARQIVFLTKSNLDIGLGEKKDYLDALQSYLVFQGRYYEAIFYYNSAVSTLKQKTGQLYDYKNYHMSRVKD